MRYLSLFSGIEAASVAWHGLGWTPVAFAEVEPFPSAVLAHRFPEVPNFGDVTNFKEWNIDEPIDLIVGGSPCQSFSVAGLRNGLDDPRGNLALTYLAIVDKYRPKWIVWENVPGVLSSNRGRDFGSFIGALDEIGYGYAWRVLDAQYCRTPDYPRAVPQRRRRIFVVGSLRSAGCAAAVLFDSESLCGNSPPSRSKREAPSPYIASSPRSNDELIYQEVVGALCADDRKQVQNQTIDQHKLILTSTPATAFKIRGGSETETGEQGGTIGRKAGKGYLGSDETAFTVAATQDQQIFYYTPQILDTIPLNTMTMQGRPSDEGRIGSGIGEPNDPAPTLSKAHHHAVATAASVRRLTPLECERLQGFPEHWTRIPWKNKTIEDCPDSLRYKAIGNSMAVNVMQWIGIRIAMVEEIVECTTKANEAGK